MSVYVNTAFPLFGTCLLLDVTVVPVLRNKPEICKCAEQTQKKQGLRKSCMDWSAISSSKKGRISLYYFINTVIEYNNQIQRWFDNGSEMVNQSIFPAKRADEAGTGENSLAGLTNRSRRIVRNTQVLKCQ